MNEQMKKVLHSVGKCGCELREIADYIQDLGAGIDLGDREADKLREAANTLEFLAYMYERLDEELERTKKQ